MPTFLRLLFLVGLLFLVAGVGRGQPAAPEDRGGVEISLVGLGEFPASVKIADGKRVLDVGVPSSGKGQSFRYRGTSPLVFFREVTDAEGKVQRVPIATVEYPAAWKKVLIVLISGGRTTDGWTFGAQAFDDSREGFPIGHARIFNFYPGMLALNSGGDVAQVPSRQSRLVKLQGAKSRVWMKVALQRESRWETLPAFVTQVAPGSRLLIFAYEEAGDAGRVECTYRTIAEVVVAETVAALR